MNNLKSVKYGYPPENIEEISFIQKLASILGKSTIFSG